VQSWANKHDRPIYLGEFGVYDKAETPSRVRYLDFIARQAEKFGWSWACWRFDSDFVLYDISKQQWNKPVLDALQPPKPSKTH
jgi:endoglucanase